MDRITFCIPSKSNLRYLKACIPSIRENAYRKDHDIIVFVDSDDDGTVKWLDEVKDDYNISYYVNPDLGNSLYGIGMAYDYCIEQSTTDIFMIFHADMMLAKDADLIAWKQLKEKCVVCSTRIEPPIHPNAGEKILVDFGMWPEDFKSKEFDNYVELAKEKYGDKTTEGIFAPWMMYKSDFLKIGGHDKILHSCREDSDVFNRMHLAGYKFIQSWQSFVYHLTGRGAGSFDGDEERHKNWQRMMANSTREFIRKWGTGVQHDALMKPIVSKKYNISFVVSGCNDAQVQLLYHIEPWCDTLYCEDNARKKYIELEQNNTSTDLSNKIKNITSQPTENIIVKFEAMQLSTQERFNFLTQLSNILTDSGQVGHMNYDIFDIEIKSLETYENELINVKN